MDRADGKKQPQLQVVFIQPLFHIFISGVFSVAGVRFGGVFDCI